MIDDYQSQMRVLMVIGVILCIVTLAVIMLSGCAASNEMKSLSDNYTSLRADLTTHMQMTTRIEGDVAAVKQTLTTQTTAGGDIRYTDIWLTLGLIVLGALYIIANEFLKWRRKKNGGNRG